MSRRFTSAQIENFCSEGFQFKGQVISTAFARCQKGNWMAWHIWKANKGVWQVSRHLRALANQAGPFVRLFDDNTPSVDERYANLIRQAYYSTGRRKRGL